MQSHRSCSFECSRFAAARYTTRNKWTSQDPDFFVTLNLHIRIVRRYQPTFYIFNNTNNSSNNNNNNNNYNSTWIVIYNWNNGINQMFIYYYNDRSYESRNIDANTTGIYCVIKLFIQFGKLYVYF